MRRVFCRTPSLAVLALAVAPFAAASPTAPAMLVGASNLCASTHGAAADARATPGHLRADPDSLTAEQVSKLGNPARRSALAAGSVNVPTIYHVISDHVLSTREQNSGPG